MVVFYVHIHYLRKMIVKKKFFCLQLCNLKKNHIKYTLRKKNCAKDGDVKIFKKKSSQFFFFSKC